MKHVAAVCMRRNGNMGAMAASYRMCGRDGGELQSEAQRQREQNERRLLYKRTQETNELRRENWELSVFVVVVVVSGFFFPVA
jgi:hypothetical protein